MQYNSATQSWDASDSYLATAPNMTNNPTVTGDVMGATQVPVTKTITPPTQNASPFPSSTAVTKQQQADTATAAAIKQVTPVTPTTTSTPTGAELPTVVNAQGQTTLDTTKITPTTQLSQEQYQQVIQQTGGNTQGWQQNPSTGQWTPGPQAIANMAISSHVTPALQGTGINATTTTDGQITMNFSDGTFAASIDPKTFTNADGTFNQTQFSEAISSVRNGQQEISTATNTYNATVDKLKAQKAQAQAQLDTQRKAAVSSALNAIYAADPGAREGSSSAQYTGAINQQFDLQQADLDQKFNEAISNAEINKNSAVSTAQTNMTSSVQSIMEKAQSVSTQQQTFAAQQQEKKLADFKTIASTFPTDIPKDTTLNAQGLTGIASVDSAIKSGVAGGLTPQGALDMLMGGTTTQKKAEATTALANIKTQDLSKFSGMSLQSMKSDALGGSLISQLTPLYGGSEQAAYEAIQNERQTQKQALDDKKEQVQIQKLQIEAALAPVRLAEMTMNQALRSVTAATTAGFKTGSWGQSMMAVAEQLPKAESAVKLGGKGFSALTLIDAMVKIDTDGQAIRQGQVNLLEDAGTYGQTLRKFKEKLNLTEDKSGNITLTSGQVKQMYDLIKETAAEKVKTNMPAFNAYNNGVNAAKAAHPEQAAEIGGIAANGAVIQQFIDEYGNKVGVSPTNQPQFPGYEFRDGKYYPTSK